MKKVFAVAVITLSTLALQAQAPHPPAASGRAQGVPHNRQPEKLAEFLQLTPEQMSGWRAVHEEVRTNFETLASRQRDAHEQMRTALKASNPDACAVGRLMIQVEAAGAERRALHEATEKKAMTLLTAEQRMKYEAWKAAQAEGDRMMIRSQHP